ncbi:MAG TPA: AMP-binding protein [Thermomonospora sp.]|nr:AMP-binding protein [Thermomonospora sp.]
MALPSVPVPSPRRVARSAARVGATARTIAEVVRSGGLETGERPSPYEVAARAPVYRLRHYFPGGAAGRPPIVLVPPLMMNGDVYDVSYATSAVRILHEDGVDPWVVDFGAPEREAGGLRRTLTDHVLAVDDAVDRVRALTGRDVYLAGYSQGGMFCYQAAAYRRSAGLSGVITFGSPVDTRGAAAALSRLPEDLVTGAVGFLADNVLAHVWVPAWASRAGFQLLNPVKAARQRLQFLTHLHDREALLPRERQRRYLQAEAWVAWPGPAMAELAHQFVVQNRMLSGGAVFGGRMVTLADITCPMLCFVGETDSIAGPAYVRAIRRAAPRAEMAEVSLPTGHFGMIAGGTAARRSWPTVAGWIRWREGRGERPEAVREPDETMLAPGTRAGIGVGVELLAGAGLSLARGTVTLAGPAVRRARTLAREAARSMPGLTRLQAVEPGTRISPGLLLEERATGSPHETFFVFGGRGYTYADAARRIDAVVRGLVAVGVRPGEHVGVLMGTRPSALALAAALNRLGAVGVLMRPDGGPGAEGTARLAREADLGEVTRIIADPERAEAALKAAGPGVPVLVLGGGARRGRLPDGVTDLERIDPDAVPLPGWYLPDPGRAQDLAFLLFTGEGDDVRVSRVTNRRWAISAFGTASAAALDRTDTVYSVSPLYHPSGLLTAFGGALASGARLALAQPSQVTGFDAAVFWDEVRRYGATVVSYTWTLLHDLVEAPPDPAERHHPVRLFAGSGMPAWLWRRVEERFAPARVLEFFAATEEDVVLVNLKGVKTGAKGRPLPGTAEVRVAAYDAARGRLVVDPAGLAVECGPGETGVLLARADRSTPAGRGRLLRGVFAPDDAWLNVGALFRRDADGDFWLVDHASDVIRTASGVVPSIPVEEALGTLDAVGMVAVYGVPEEPGGPDTVVAAVTLRPGRELGPADLTAALADLDPASWPAVVRVVPQIPRTAWFRPSKGALRAEGVPPGGPGRRLTPEGRYTNLA